MASHQRSLLTPIHAFLSQTQRERIEQLSELSSKRAAQLIDEINQSQRLTREAAIIEVFSVMADHGLNMKDLEKSFIRDAV